MVTPSVWRKELIMRNEYFGDGGGGGIDDFKDS
jgi:hypothetical protein